MPDTDYSLPEIKVAWSEYKKAQVFSVLKNGKWEDIPLVNGATIPKKVEGTAAKTHFLKDVIGFPEFLEKYWVSK